MDLSLFPDCLHLFGVAATQQQTSLQSTALTIFDGNQSYVKNRREPFPQVPQWLRLIPAC